MGKKDKIDHRFSFAMTEELKDRLMAKAKEMTSPDNPIRPSDICRMALEKFLEEAPGEETTPIQDFGLLEVIGSTARKLGVSVGSLVTTILTENLEKYIEQGEQRQKRLRELKERARREDGSP